jgi:hypothetical protein
MKKSILFYFGLLLFAGSITLGYYGCKKKATETCTDGIQNQGETGVDCGGPCTACATASALCSGISSANSYFPLTSNDTWTYNNIGPGSGFDRSVSITGTQAYGVYTYYVVHSDEEGITSFDNYLRYSAGTVYEYDTQMSAEYTYLPASPVAGQTLHTYSGGSYWKVISTNASVTTAACTYTGCLQMGHYNADNSLSSTHYFKKNVGEVKESTFSSIELTAVSLH